MYINMSEDEKDIDIESDCEEEDDSHSSSGGNNSGGRTAPEGPNANKRAHHNALERRRRDHIKDSFTSLRDCVPALVGEKSSRAQILKKASDYIDFMKKKIQCHQTDIEMLEKQNAVLETQLKALEKTKFTGNFAAMAGDVASSGGNKSYLSSKSSDDYDEEAGEDEGEEEEEEEDDSQDAYEQRRKKLKT